MKKHSTKNSKRIYQFTLSKDGEKILEEFATKYGTTKSVIIDRALRYLAAQYHRKITISYELGEEISTTTTSTNINPEVEIITKKQPREFTTEEYLTAKAPWIDE